MLYLKILITLKSNRRKRQGDDKPSQSTQSKRSPTKTRTPPVQERNSGSSQDSSVGVVRRQIKDSDAHLRRGSLKSRIFQFRKGRRKPEIPENVDENVVKVTSKDTTDNAAAFHSNHDNLLIQDQSALVIKQYDKEPLSARQRAPLVVSLRDNTPPSEQPIYTPPSEQPIYAKPVKKQFRIQPEDKIQRFSGRSDKENIRNLEPLRLSGQSHTKDYHEVRKPLGLSIPAPNSPTKASSRGVIHKIIFILKHGITIFCNMISIHNKTNKLIK